MMYIYCLASEDTIWYVGRTKDLRTRERYHRRKTDKGCGADLIPDNVNWNFIVLEEISDDHAPAGERFYYEWLQPTLNRKYPGRSQAEAAALYYQNHKEQKAIRSRINYEKKQREKMLRSNITDVISKGTQGATPATPQGESSTQADQQA